MGILSEKSPKKFKEESRMRNLKRALSLALASVMVMGLMVVGTGASYVDVSSEQNQEAIEVLQEVGIMTGDENGNFNPNAKVTRNEMAVVMSNLLDYRVANYKGTSPFTDVPSWAEPYVAACYTNGIIAGYDAKTFGGSDSVTTSQAALMLMKALGYFQYQSDFEDDWQFATIKQAGKIELFEDVDSGVTEAMTRNDLAQLVLNALESGMVEADDDTIKVNADGVIVEAGKVTYNYVTSDKAYARAISDLQPTSSTSSTKGSIVELGEKLYNGDLKKDEGSDDFNRPANVWTYKSSEIGKYADSAEQTWTVKVTEKALYQAVGSAAFDNYDWAIYQNGGLVAEDTNAAPHAARDLAIAHSKTSSERVLTADKGVLTEVFVDSDKETVVLTLIDTGVAKVTKVTGDEGDYEVTVSFKTKVNNGAGSAYTPDNKFTTDQKFEKDDIVIYTASVSSGEIESLAVAETVAGKVTAVKNADYATLDGTKYSYNYAYTKAVAANGIGTGLYNLEDSVADANPVIDKEATLYLDAYGYAVAFEGDTATAEDYLFVKEVGTVFDSEPSAKVVFYDGTEDTITVDQIIDGGKSYDAVKSGGDNSTTKTVAEKTIYKFTKGSSSYDLEVVAEKAGTSATVKKDVPSISATGTADGQATNNNTVFVDVENNNSWVGYKNVSSKTGADVKLVLNSDNVAEVVFIYGNFTSDADAEDYIILKGTGYQAEKDKNNKTVYRFIDAYDANGEKVEDLYTASETLAKNAKKAMYLIEKRDGDDYVQTWTPKFDLKNNAGKAAANWATAAKDGVLTLNTGITFGGKDKKTFAYDDNTVFVVVELKANGDVDLLRTGDISDIEADTTRAADTTGVYVMTVDNEYDQAPLAETVLVVVPDDKGITEGGKDPVVTTDGSVTVGLTNSGSLAMTITAPTIDGKDISGWEAKNVTVKTTLTVDGKDFAKTVSSAKDEKVSLGTTLSSLDDSALPNVAISGSHTYQATVVVTFQGMDNNTYTLTGSSAVIFS